MLPVHIQAKKFFIAEEVMYAQIDDGCIGINALSKSPKKDWEIVSGRNDVMGVHEWDKNCVVYKCVIHSVRRLSDNEVFSIGDKICGTGGSFYRPIVSFRINENKMEAVFNETGWCTSIEHYQKLPKQENNEVKDDKFEWTFSNLKALIKYCLGDSAGNLTDYGIEKSIYDFKKSIQNKIEVKGVAHSAIHSGKDYEQYVFHVTKGGIIPTDKFKAIKEAIESVLNK